jgi:dolichol kinase
MMICVELLYRCISVRREYTRKFIHVLSCLYALAATIYLPTKQYFISTLFFLGIILVSRLGRYFRSIHVYRKTYGDILLPLGLLLIHLALRETHHFVPAFLIIAFADTVAGLSMRRSKSWYGSLLFCMVSIDICILFYGMSYSVILLAIGAMVVERISTHGWDNLTVPLFLCIAMPGLF